MESLSFYWEHLKTSNKLAERLQSVFKLTLLCSLKLKFEPFKRTSEKFNKLVLFKFAEFVKNRVTSKDQNFQKEF